ncbi:MAG TPA: hypothetical protein VFN79_11440, partial [Steroidobacteraceae bacterium]|nr:hypothetical protein [Steroidobacteraceae bacterium]
MQRRAHGCTQRTEAHTASLQRIVSPLTKDVSYRAQVRVKGRGWRQQLLSAKVLIVARQGRSAASATFPNLKEAEAWVASIETAIREGRHFPHAAAKRATSDASAPLYGFR